MRSATRGGAVPFSKNMWELPARRMRYFAPKLTLGVLLPMQTALEDKFGGLPWGLSKAQWPMCRACGKPQTMIAQLAHHRDRLDLGREGRVLFIFQCDHNPGGCATWEGDSGANACFVIEPQELGAGLTETPTWETTIEVEARVVRWTERDDGVPADRYPQFLREETHQALDEAERAQVHCGTKLGGIPAWLQSAGEAPNGWRFVAQIDSCHSFEGNPPPAEELGSTVTRAVGGKYEHEEPWIKKRGAPPWVSVREDDSWICDAANFGDMGRAYIFVRPNSERAPEAWFFWQC